MQQEHHHNSSNITPLVPLPDYDVTELKLENGHLAMYGLGGIAATSSKSTRSNRACDTLESIVHQATCHSLPEANLSSMAASSSGGTWTADSGHQQMENGWIRKRTRSDSNYQGKNNISSTSTTSNVHEEQNEYHMDNDATINTWNSFESAKTKSNDSTCHEGMEIQEGARETTKEHESGRSRSRPRRVAAIHNQSERKRRDRINQKMKALQRLVPNANKTDKASMLDEVIRYLELLQAQFQMMSSMRNEMQPHMNMMMPLQMQQQQQQQQQQMAVLARMGMTPVVPSALGMGMGMGMLNNVNNMARMAPHQSLPQAPLVHPNTPASFLPPFMMPQLMQLKPAPATNVSSDSYGDPYCALLAQQQSMNMDLFNRMAAVFRQQVDHQSSSSSPSQPKH